MLAAAEGSGVIVTADRRFSLMIFSGLNGHTMTFFSPCFQQLIYRQKYLSYFLNTVFIHNWLLCAEKGCFIFIYPEGNENNQREDNENNSEEGVR